MRIQNGYFLVGMFVLVAACATTQMYFGQFEGPFQLQFLNEKPGDRRMQLLQDVSYRDPSGKAWTAPKGYATDGASIPRALWSILGGPFDGPYRQAAVIHDYYCDIKTESSKDVHRIFYYAARASGVGERMAKVLYGGVLAGGPKWGSQKSSCHNCHQLPPNYGTDRNGVMFVRPVLTEQDAKKIAAWIEKTSPSLEEIDQFIEREFPKNVFGH